MGIEEMDRRGEEITADQIRTRVPQLCKTKRVQSQLVAKTEAEMRFEAKQKLRYKRAAELAPKWCLYALRHSWATLALENGIDALTVAILMGHKEHTHPWIP
jgi:site-specific recombinase XerD